MATKRANRLKVLEAMPGSRDEIIAATGLGLATVWRWVEDLVASNEAHLHRYKVSPSGGPLIAIYHPGPARKGHIPAKPRLSTDLERTRKYRRNARKSGAWEDIKAKSRAAYWRKKQPQRDPLVAALFGKATRASS